MILRIRLQLRRRRRQLRRDDREPRRAADGLVRSSSSISLKRARNCSDSDCSRPSRVSPALRSASRSAALSASCSFSVSRCNFSAADPFDLRCQRVNPLAHFRERSIQSAAAHRCRGSMALLQRRDACSMLRSRSAPTLRAGRRSISSDSCPAAICCSSSSPLHVAVCRSRTAARTSAFLLGALGRKSLQFQLATLQPLAHPAHLGIKLLQHVARRHRLLFRFALLALQPVEQGSESLISRPRVSTRVSSSRSALLQLFQLTHHVAQFALHRERTFAALLASGDGHVVEALAGSAKGRMRPDSPAPARARTPDRARCSRRAAWAESLPATSRIHSALGSCFSAERSALLAAAECAASSTTNENFACESSGWTRNVARPSTSVRSKSQPFIGRIPRLHDDVIQFIAQEIFHHSLVTRLDFQKIRQHSHREPVRPA